MAVVINDFEVLPAEPPTSSPGGATVTAEQEATMSPSEYELQQLLKQQHERSVRVWAH
jgi:hypothetical protein